MPGQCLPVPEAIAEYPDGLGLGPELRLAVRDAGRWRAAGVGLDAGCAYRPRGFGGAVPASARDWKAGGRPPRGRSDPYPRSCAICETRMVPLLAIAPYGWGNGTCGWVPCEDQASEWTQPAGVEVGSTDNMQIYVCPASPEHPHTDLIQ
ncbi:hypothetical protein ACXNSR_00105 [Streptomyces sp. NC-S4]